MPGWFDFATVSATGSHVLPVLLDTAAKSLIVLVPAVVATAVMRRSSAAARHFVWFLAVAGLLILPVLSATLPGWHILPRWIDVSADAAPNLAAAQPPESESRPPASFGSSDQLIEPEGTFTPTITLPAAIGEVEATPAEPTTEGQEASAIAPLPDKVGPDDGPRRGQAYLLAACVPLLWAAGTSLVLGWLCLGMVAMRRLGRRSQPINDDSWARLLSKLSAELNLDRSVHLLQSDRRSMPMAWGIFRPRLLLPAEASSWPADRCRVVLLHELAHIKRRDPLTQFITQIACALYWFNPLVWIAARRMVTERERACDDLVLAAGSPACDYADHVLQIASSLRTNRLVGVAAIAMARPSALEGRLLAILDNQRSRRALTRTAVALLVVAFAVIILPIGMMRAMGSDERSETEPPPQVNTEQASPAAAVAEDTAGGDPATSAPAVIPGHVIERTVNADAVGKDCIIDLDTGKLATPPQNPDGGFPAWFKGQGLDAGCTVEAASPGLWGFDMVVAPASAEAWDKQDKEPFLTLRNHVETGTVGTPAVMSAAGKLPATYVFKTREGGVGVLQIVGFSEEPKGLKIRYQMLLTGNGPRTAAPTTQTAFAVGDRNRPTSKPTANAADLKQIGIGCLIYAEGHDGKLPADLKSLARARVLQFPPGKPNTEAYVYIGGGQFWWGDPRNVIAYEKPENHDNKGTNVLLLGNELKWMKPEELENALKETRERLSFNTQTQPVYAAKPPTTGPAQPPFWLSLILGSPIAKLQDFRYTVSSARSLKGVGILPPFKLVIHPAESPSRTVHCPLSGLDRLLASVRESNSDGFGVRVAGDRLGNAEQKALGELTDGQYLAAIYLDDIRCSNIAPFTVDSKYDPAKIAPVELSAIESGPMAFWPDLALRITGPTPKDPDLNRMAMVTAPLIIDGIEHRVIGGGGSGDLYGALPSGSQMLWILHLAHYPPELDPSRPHVVKIKVGKWESNSVTIAPAEWPTTRPAGMSSATGRLSATSRPATAVRSATRPAGGESDTGEEPIIPEEDDFPFLARPWISLLPRQLVVKSLADLTLVAYACLAEDSDPAVKTGDWEIRSADQTRRVGLVPADWPSSPGRTGSSRPAIPRSETHMVRPSDEAHRRASDLKPGDYLLAWIVAGKRVSNVVRFRIGSGDDSKGGPLLEIEAVEAPPDVALPLLAIRARRHAETDPAPLWSEVAYPKLIVDGQARRWEGFFWMGGNYPLHVGEEIAYLLDLTMNLHPPVEADQIHRVTAIVGSLRSPTIRLEVNRRNEKAWDEANTRLPQPQVSLRGRVTAPDGKPGAGYDVYIRDEALPGDGIQARADYQGRYVFHDLPVSMYTVRANLRRSAEPSLEVKGVAVASGRTREQDFDLTSRVQISGKVVDQHGKPIAGRKVWSTWESEDGRQEFRASGVTDAEGKYQIGSPLPTAAFVRPSGPGERPSAYHNVRDFKEPLDFVINLGG